MPHIHPVTMDAKSLELLEFHLAKARVADFASFELSSQALRDLQPLTDRRQILERLAESAEARRLLSLLPDFSIGQVSDIDEVVTMAAHGVVLAPAELALVAQTLHSIAAARRRIKDFIDELPRLWAIAQHMADLHLLANDIVRGIGPSGEILDSLSPRLFEMRRQMIDARQQLVEQLEVFVMSPNGKDIVTDQIVTQRDGRYVIPIKSELRKQVHGIVHDVSNSGATVFMEPFDTIEQGNLLRELEVGERSEIEKVLRERCNALGLYKDKIAISVAAILELDVAVAKARYAREAQALEPTVLEDSVGENGRGATLFLKEARHPLLGSSAVPLTLEMGSDFQALVVTGPNTGGKTVMLKTVGLLSAMMQAGLPIPASDGSALPVFDSIFADIGDEQSIEQTLSTFSWHMSNLVRIVTNSTNRSLVLLDEPGSSTDPSEGSALARALLHHFLEHHTLTLATTHYTDVKVFAHVTPGLQNASLEFDPVTKKPTYRLHMGLPGGSNALATAARLGLPEALVEIARSMMPKAEQQLSALLQDLETEKQAVETLTRNLLEERLLLQRKSQEFDEELARQRKEDRLVINEARDNVAREAAALHRQMREVSAELRKTRGKSQLEVARKTLNLAQEKLESSEFQVVPPTATETVPVDDGQIRVGDTIRIRGTNTDATVLSISEKNYQMEVQCGQTKLWLGVDTVDKIATTARPLKGTISIKPRTSDVRVPMELDLRGRRADEIEPALDTYLNAATLSGIPSARIIHGFGTGTVRDIVRDYVSTSRLVRRFRPGQQSEGGDGVTVLEF
ncbi:MAG: endonuclease MutS2 [Dehalococcoidia bacterium]|nr:endonuclease MutS2 [Dehalococcoidia bacterium]